MSAVVPAGRALGGGGIDAVTAASASTRPAPATLLSPNGRAVCWSILLDLRKGQRGIDLKHVGDDGCHAGRRGRGAEERVKHRRINIVDAGNGDRVEKKRSVR